MVHSGNRYLSIAEMTVNAKFIYDYLTIRRWSKNSIAGMLGNMQTESTINPGIWQNLYPTPSNGYGLVQWTPSTNYTNWANARGYPNDSMVGQLERIEYELQQGLQWIMTSDYPLTFTQFKFSNESPEYLAQAFLRNYERPANQNQPIRSSQARYWYDILEGGGGGVPHFPTTEGLPITSGYGWRIHPITLLPDFHAAIDISGGGVNHPIYATQSGVVIRNTWNDLSGWYVRIRHTGDPYFSQYLHLSVQSPIPEGTTVQKGQRIGTMGTTGSSTGIHLDFAIATSANGFFTEEGTIDPLEYLTMNFGSDGGTGDSLGNTIISMLLTDTLNGWKF